MLLHLTALVRLFLKADSVLKAGFVTGTWMESSTL